MPPSAALSRLLKMPLMILLALIAAGFTTIPSYADENHTVELAAKDIAYDPVSGKIFASVAGDSRLYPNSVVVIEPTSGNVEKSYLIGGEPRLIAISDNGRYLYVSQDATGSYRQVNLLDGTLSSPVYVHGVRQMAVLPGHQDTLVIMRGEQAGLGLGAALFRDGMQLPETGGANSFALSFAGQRLYIYENEIDSYDFDAYQVVSDGLTEVDHTSMFSFNLGILGDRNGRLYTTNGQVVDPETHHILGALTDPGQSIVPDPAVGKIFSLNRGQILAFDYRTFLLRDSFTTPGLPTTPQQLIRWGADGLAVRGERSISILRTSFVGKLLPEPDLSVTETHTPHAITPARPVVFTLTVTNHGPGAATGVVLTQKLHPALPFISAHSTIGTVSYPNSTIELDLPSLAQGKTVTITAIFAPAKTGTCFSSTVVRGDQADSNQENNTFFEPLIVSPDLRPDLTATWKPAAWAPGVKPGRPVVQASLIITNRGRTTAPPSITRVTLSSPKDPTSPRSLLAELPTGAIPAGGEQTLTVQIPADPTSPAGRYLFAEVNASMAVDESDTGNNNAELGPIPIPPDQRPELNVKWGAAHWTSRPRPLIEAELDISNTGLTGAPPSTTRIYLADSPYAIDKGTLLETIATGPVPPKGELTIPVQAIMPAGVDLTAKVLVAIVNATQTVDEIDRSNDGAVLRQIPAPAALTGSWGDVTSETSNEEVGRFQIKASFSLINQGGTDNSCSIKFILAKAAAPGKGDILLQGMLIGQILGGENRHIDLHVELPPGVSPSGRYIIAEINADHRIFERDYSNNTIVAGPIP